MAGEPVTTAAEMSIEPVTRYRCAAEGYTSNAPKNYGGNARLVPISLPRIRWLERPVVGEEMKEGK